MMFPKKFTRRVGAVSEDPVLGTDAEPTVDAQRRSDGNTCGFSARLANIVGWPVQRVCVGYQGPNGAPALTCTLYLWDDNSKLWYVCEPVKALPFRQISWFDAPILSDNATRDEGVKNPGSLDVYVKVDSAGGVPDGVYTFIVGADCSGAVD